MNNNKVVIITGATRGIGLSTAMKFAANNYNVTLVGRDQVELDQIKLKIEKNYNAEALVCAGDLANEAFLGQIVEDTVRKWGRIDTLINNAAWRTIETMRNISLENWNKTIKVCLTAPAFLAKSPTLDPNPSTSFCAPLTPFFNSSKSASKVILIFGMPAITLASIH